MTRAVFKSIRGLLFHPNDEWRDIHNQYHGSALYVLRHYFLIFFVLIPLAISLRLVFNTFNVKFIFLRGWLVTWVILGGYIFILYLLSIVVEEAAEFIGAVNSVGIGTKIAFFSALPFLAMSVFAPIPKVGLLMLAVGFLYQIYLLFTGGSQLLNLQGSKRILWFIAVIIAFLLLLFLILLLAALLTIIFQLI